MSTVRDRSFAAQAGFECIQTSNNENDSHHTTLLNSRMQIIKNDANIILQQYLELRQKDQESIIQLEVENEVLKEELRSANDQLTFSRNNYNKSIESLQRECKSLLEKLAQSKEKEIHLQEHLEQKIEIINKLFKENCLLEEKIHSKLGQTGLGGA